MLKLSNHKEYVRSLVLLTIAIVAYIAQFALNAFVASKLPKELYGDFSVALRALGIASIVFMFGTTSSAKRFLSNFIRSKRLREAEDYLIWNIRFNQRTFAAGLGFCVLLTATLFLVDYFQVRDSGEYHMAIYILWVAPLAGISALLTSYLSSNNNVYWAVLLSGVGRNVILFAFFVLGAVYLGKALQVADIAALIFLTYLVLLLLQSMLVAVKLPLSLWGAYKNKNKADRLYDKEWPETARHLLFTSITYTIFASTDIFIVELLHPSETAVGLYAVALIVAGMLWLAPSNAYGTLTPKISYLYENARDKLQQKISRYNLVVILVNSILLLTLFLVPNIYLDRFGGKYEQAHDVLWILASGNIIATLSGIGYMLLSYTGESRLVMFINLFLLGVAIVAGVILTALYSIVGTACSAVLVNICQMGLAVYYVRKRLGLRLLWLV